VITHIPRYRNHLSHTHRDVHTHTRAMEHVIAERAGILRDILQEYRVSGTQIACLPATTHEFVAVVQRVLDTTHPSRIPLVVIDWKGEGNAPSSGGGVIEHGVDEAARHGVGVSG
jgi:hypothetical protein